MSSIFIALAILLALVATWLWKLGKAQFKKLFFEMSLVPIPKFTAPLGKMGRPRVIDDLLNVLKDKKSVFGNRTASALVEIKYKRVIGTLINALNDKEKTVRRHAASALGNIKDPRAVDALINTLKDKNSEVLIEAARALDDSGTLFNNTITSFSIKLDDSDSVTVGRSLIIQ